MTGMIHQLNVSDGGVPKLAIEEGEVTKQGLVGDRCANTRIHGGPQQALSLLGLEVIEKLAGEGHPIAPGTTGENVTIRGLDWPRIEPGMRLRIGDEVLVEITRYASPCKNIAGSFADGDVRRLSQLAAPGQSRLYAEVLREGVIRTGDVVTLESSGPLVTSPGPDADRAGSRALESLRLNYVNLHVTDLQRSIEFFEKTLGLDLQFADERFGYASFDVGPVRMGIARIDPTDEQNSGLTARQTGFGFAVDDLAAAHRELEARGVTFPMKPAKQPWGGFMALFEDPDGNVFYLDQIQTS